MVQYKHKCMKRLSIIIIVVLFLAACKNRGYYKEEVKAIQDIANDYLQKNLLDEVVTIFDGEVIKFTPFIDSLSSRVYFSDALLPISQIKKDDEWMFNGNYSGTPDSAIFYGIINSKRFFELKYREFDKSKIELIKPFTQIAKSQEKKETDGVNTTLQFSRVCFDDKRENGVMVIEYLRGYGSDSMYGYNGALLIKKQNGKWTYIHRK